jgi:predicted amidohydrolase YtcJ
MPKLRPPVSAARFALAALVLHAPLAMRDLEAQAPKAASTSAPVTLAIINARVWTGNPAQPWAEAVAVTGERIAIVGTSAEVKAQTPASARTIDAKGALVTPGFIDSHVHFLDGGRALQSVQLRDASTRAEFIKRIAAQARRSPKGSWITNGDWDHQLWGGELPQRSWIDSVTPDNPVWINRLDGHMQLANTAALKAAKVDKSAKDVAGGTIVRDAKGELTGVFKDNAMGLVDRAVPARTAAEWDKTLDTAMKYVAERGVTTVRHVGDGDVTSWTGIGVLRRAHDQHTLITRVIAYTPLSDWKRLKDDVAKNGHGDDWFRMDGLKGFVDGSLGSHTAAMYRPFTDTPKDSGFFVTPPESLYAWTKGADAAGLHVTVHAIGDRAIRTQLDIYERVARENGAKDRRFAIEHAQHVAPGDFARFAKLGVVASMQPYHAIDDGRWADKVIGAERAKGTYAFKSFLDAGATLAFGSDWFVAPPTPLEGLQAAVTRRTLDGKNPGGWVPAQKITLEQALTAYTRGGAYVAFLDTKVGMLKTGMLADIVVLDRDLFKVAPETIADAKVRATVVGGRVVFERAAK